jgi:hypothetical protein
MLPAGVENEPMLLLDTTGSMTYKAAENSNVTRWDVITEALGGVVEVLAAKDSQAEAEAAAGEDAGGLMTVTFADGEAEDLEDLNPGNWKAKLASVQLGGHTEVMPGWNRLVDVYLEEFGTRPKEDRPHLLALVITDGEAQDTAEFAAQLAQSKGGTYVCVAILGYGAEHDAALAAYQKVADANDHVRVVSFDSQTDPTVITDSILSLIGG